MAKSWKLKSQLSQPQYNALIKRNRMGYFIGLSLVIPQIYLISSGRLAKNTDMYAREFDELQKAAKEKRKHKLKLNREKM
jgi:hypothetical protein